MSRPHRRLQLRRYRSLNNQTTFHHAKHRSNRIGFEPLEKRCLLTATLNLAGTQTLLGGANIDASNDHASQQQNNSIDINPINPLHLAGLSQRNTPTSNTSLGLYRSLDGGLTWSTTTIDNTVDSLAASARRFDPVLAYDSTGNLYVTYCADNGTTTTLIALTSADDGATFTQVKTVATIADAIGSISKPGIGTGSDGLGNQAVYIAFTESAIGIPGILVSGSHDGGATFTSPVLVSDLAHTVTDAHPAVGPAGQLYVSWLDATDSAVRFDRDLDGLFAAVNSFGADVTVVNNSTARPTLSGNFQIFFNQLVPAQPNHGINSQPELDVDRSASANNGTLYISFADLFNAAGNDVDVYVARSVNQGANWTFAPVATGSATEFLPAVDIDQSSGSVNVLYYSTFGDTATGNDDVNVMLATSIDAGQSFVNNQKLTSAASRASTILGGNDFGDYIGLAVFDGTVQALWADNRGPSLEVEAMTASDSFASATDGNALTVTGTAAADTVLIRRSAANHAFVEIVVNGQLQYAGLLASLDNIIVNTLDASDSLTIDNTNGVVSTAITYDGGTTAGDHDTLAITGDPGVSIARETYLAGATVGSGMEVVDPDGSRGAGLNTAGNGDELMVTFSNLEPIQTDIPVVVFDVILNTSDNIGTVQDGGLLNGANSLQLISGNATFESVQFAKKQTARIMGNSGADTLTADYTTAAVGLTGLELYGHLAADVLGQPVDDNLADTLKVLRNAAGVAHLLHGNGGDDSFTVGNGDLSLILSPVSVIGDAGNDSLVVDDSVRTVDVDYYVDPTTIAICTSPGPPPVHANIALYDATLENARLNGTQGTNRFDVTPSADTTLFIDGNEPHVPPGDLISIRFAGTTGAQLTNTAGAGMWSFTNRKSVQFEEIERFDSLPVVVYGAEAAKNGKPTVKVVDATTGALIISFLAYESTYTGGVRVAVGDVNGDGIPEIITAPGLKHLPTVKIFNISTGAEMTGMAFSAYPNAFVDGVNVAIGDVNADGLNDIVTSPSHGKTEIHTYLNQTATNPAVPFDNTHRNRFLAFDKKFIGGGSVAVGDVSDDAKAEILVGSGAGMRDEVRKFDGMTNGSVSTPAPFLQHFKPFDASMRGGVTVAVANLDADPQLEIVVGSGTGGHSQIATFDTSNLSVPLHTFLGVYTGNGSNAPVRTAAIDTNFDGISDIFAAQGPDGRSQEIRRTGPLGPVVDFLMDNDVEFRNGFYLAADASGTTTFMC